MKSSSESRRRFLLQGSAAAAGFAAFGASLPGVSPDGPAPAAADPNAPARPASSAASAQPGPALPPPPARDTYRARMEAARGLMKIAKAHALIETPSTNMRYLTGLSLRRSERLVAFVLPIEGAPMILCPAFERDLIAASPAGIEEFLVWEEDEDPIGILEKHFKRSRLADKQIAVGSTMWYDEFVLINQAMPKLAFISTTPVIGLLRETKSSEEVAIMQAATDITERAIEAALREVREGMREDELAGIITARIKEAGAQGAGLVQFGPRSAVPHNPTSDRSLAAGDAILIDFGAQVHGYWSDISRPAILGRASGRMKLIHSTIRMAQDLALERARPGMVCEALDQIARSTVGGRGFYKLFVHRLGHGIGLDGHEPPYLTKGYQAKLAAGNVATLEPGVYTPGEYGIRIEDMMEVTAGGGRFLSKPPEAMLEL